MIMNDFPFRRRFTKMVLALLVMIAKQVYKGQLTTADNRTLLEAQRLIDEI